MLHIRSLFRVVLALAQAVALGSASCAYAQEAAPQPEDDIPLAADFGAPLPEDQLESLRGGFDLVKNDMQLTSAVTGNSALNVLSGNNAIADGAFSNASGLPMVIQNSGSNVSIQNATVVNVQLQ